MCLCRPHDGREYCGLKLHVEHFRSHSAGFCLPIRSLFHELGNRFLSLWMPGWGLVYTALSTMDGFSGQIHHCICTEQYMLSKADHPEAQLVSVFGCWHQFLLYAGTNIFILVLWNQPGSWSISKLTQSESRKKWTLTWICPDMFHCTAACAGTQEGDDENLKEQPQLKWG